jgi:N-carbamoylputrescine amidase
MITTVGLVQMRCGTDVQQNLDRALAGVEEAAGKGAQIVCLQELFRSQYFCQSEDTATFDLAEPIPGPSTEAIGRVAAARQVTVVASLFEKRAEGVFHNTAVLIGPDGAIAGLYRKMHIPDDPLYYEKYYFTPGDVGFRSFDTGRGTVGALVCWDQWFPEAARLTALHGAEILFYPTAIGWHRREKDELGAAQYDAWQTIQRSHAIANGVFVAAVNRVGREGSLEFWGGSFVADPFGRVLARASHDREEVLVVRCDRRLIADTRRNWPFLRDRRIDAYDGLLKRYLD